MTDPPRAAIVSSARSANFAASLAAASSPRWLVKIVYPRTSAIRKVLIWMSSEVEPPERMFSRPGPIGRM